jgi:hypothetical protein
VHNSANAEDKWRLAYNMMGDVADRSAAGNLVVRNSEFTNILVSFRAKASVIASLTAGERNPND